MLNKDNIDLKIIFSLTTAYEDLYKKGEITEKQLEEIFSLLDNFQKITASEAKEKIREIFPEEDL